MRHLSHQTQLSRLHPRAFGPPKSPPRGPGRAAPPPGPHQRPTAPPTPRLADRLDGAAPTLGVHSRHAAGHERQHLRQRLLQVPRDHPKARRPDLRILILPKGHKQRPTAFEPPSHGGHGRAKTMQDLHRSTFRKPSKAAKHSC